tara:strand:+ start:1431 stop:2750 length:1320 start_codon:yes stop_codon:yes gene_type:complete
MQNYKIIIELESNNSRLFKESILLREMNAKNDIFFEGLKFACNKLITFGVKKVPELKIDGPGISWFDFKKLVIDLNNRVLTGNAAKEAIQSLMEKSNADEWNFFFRRILIKDLRCGLSEKTINNVAKKNNFLKYQIPVFNCQLAQDSDQQKKKMNGSKILEVKLDGVRVISILYKSGKVDMFSRNGKELLNFENVKEQLLNTLKEQNINESIVLDGEIVSKNFQELMKQIYRKDNIQNNDATLFLFDYLTLQEFKNGICNIIQSERILKLKKWYNSNKEYISNIKLLESNIVDLDTNEGKTKFKDFNNHAVLEGYEGIMIKDPNSIYEAKRSSSWLKSKPIIEVSLIVKSLEEGTGKNKGRLGAVFATGNDSGKNFKLSVGSGFTDIQRDSFWQEKDKLIGQIIEIKADAITKSKDSKYWSLRFPRFKTFRGFNEGEKI